MKCIKCGRFSFGLICQICKQSLKNPTLSSREISGVKIYSFYPYLEIKDLIFSKHKEYGRFVFNTLAKQSFKEFSKNFKFGEKINIIAIDDRIISGYSHTAILAKNLKNKELIPLYNCLQDSSNIRYSGKNLEFRIQNKRKFILKKIPKYPVILVDDVITSGLTFSSAIEICKKNNICVLFGLTLANAKE